MKLEIVEVTGGLGSNPIPPGHVALNKTGAATFVKADLDKLKITHAATLLVDTSTLIIGVRAPRTGDKPAKVSVKGRRCHIGLLPALRKCGFKGVDVAGRYKLEFTDGGKTAIVRLAGKQLTGDAKKR